MQPKQSTYIRFSLQYQPTGRAQTWTPAMNAFGCRDRIVVCLDLAGVEKDSIELIAEPRRLRVRGVRRAPEPPCDGPFAQILALEIDYGPFEREIALPFAVESAEVRAEQENGLLWIELPTREGA